eukprot:scaffold51292_cov57-Phaeocystis_antarctica.AAC.4
MGNVRCPPRVNLLLTYYPPGRRFRHPPHMRQRTRRPRKARPPGWVMARARVRVETRVRVRVRARVVATYGSE